MKKLIGFQLANKNGDNIQGTENDPTGLASFEVMSPAAAIKVISEIRGFLLMPIYDGDVEAAQVVE